MRRTAVSLFVLLCVGPLVGANGRRTPWAMVESVAAALPLQGPGGSIPDQAPGFRLLGHQTLLGTSVTLTPSDTSVVETLTGPTILDVRVPPDARRTLVVLELTQSFNYHQIVSAVPLRASVGARLFISSSALPGGSFEALSFFAQGESVSGSASAIDNVHSAGWQSRYQLDREFLSINLQFGLGLSQAGADALAATLMQSDLRFTIQPTATVRSVADVTFGRVRSLQVWGE